MIAKSTVITKIQSILPMISPEEFPEIYVYLSSLPGIDKAQKPDDLPMPFEIANSILSMDRPGELPKDLVDIITDLFEMEIAEGNSAAMNDLGACYYEGSRGFEQSFEKAVHYYKMAAEKGNRQSQENLGYCYYYGREGEPDYEKAFHYYALGAFDGHMVSLYKIGDMYLHGLYVHKNEKEAFYIFMRCIETMTDEAAYRVAGPVYLRLGRMFLDGVGTEQNLKNALICFQKAESYLYDMVLGGDVMYKKSLSAAVKGQEETREKLSEQLPENKWSFDE